MNNGWIKLHRSILDWEWYDDTNTRMLFIHCLLKANCRDVKYRGDIVKRGCFLTSVEILSSETSLTISQIRSSLNKLKMTNDIANETSSKGSIISITNYDLYQSNDKPVDKEIASDLTNESQTDDKPIATNKNIRSIKKEKESVYPESFETFWSSYSRPKNKGSKPEALKEWQKLSDQDKVSALQNISAYKESQSNPEYMKHAERYLKSRAWEGVNTEEPKEDDWFYNYETGKREARK